VTGPGNGARTQIMTIAERELGVIGRRKAELLTELRKLVAYEADLRGALAGLGVEVAEPVKEIEVPAWSPE
jgi:hypothetical protein